MRVLSFDSVRGAINSLLARVSAFPWSAGFTFDLRSLALFRILFGLVILGDLIFRGQFIEDFYTDQGVLPRSAVRWTFHGPWNISLHLLWGSWGAQSVLFLLTGLCVLSMTVGLHTRVSTILSWLLIDSMQVRHLGVLQGGDDIVRVMLFWSIFAPLGERFSCDQALRDPHKYSTHSHRSLGAAFLVLQLCIVYWFTAALKLHPIWYFEGSAVYYALSLEEFVQPLGTMLLPFYPLLRQLSFAVLSMEFLLPTFALSPLFTNSFRAIAVVGFVLLHVITDCP